MVKLSAPKAILFDWDNTLVDTWPIIHESLAKTFTQMGLEVWTMEMVKQRVARSMRDSFPIIFGDKWQEAAEIYQSTFRSIHLQRLTALANAEEMLKFIASNPVYLAVVSNKKGVNLRLEVEHIGWNKYFSKVIGADDTARDKPFPEPVHAALEGSGIALNSDVWFIGDSEVDMECAYATGCTPIFYGELPKSKLSHDFHKRVESHNELIKLYEEVF
ncbi:MAG: HAD family hydrolase [Pseudomonadota bacterium]